MKLSPSAADIASIREPSFKENPEVWTPSLIKSDVNASGYNFIYYGEYFWAAHQSAGAIEFKNINKLINKRPIFVSDSCEELEYIIKIFPFRRRESLNIIKFIGKRRLLKRLGNNIFCLSDRAIASMPAPFSESPRVKSRRIPRADLFSIERSYPILIHSFAPSRTCNYRCKYCFNHDYGFYGNRDGMALWRDHLWLAAEKIKGPLSFCSGSRGEPLLQSVWVTAIAGLLEKKSVWNVAFASNLTSDPRDVIPNFDPNRVGITGTYHPTQFADADQDAKIFCDRVLSLKKDGVDIAVNYVLIPEQIEAFQALRAYFGENGVPMTCNLIRGRYGGKMYPGAYTDHELSLAKNCHSETPFVWDFQSFSKSPFNTRCSAGRIGLQMDFDGWVYNCIYSRQRLGHIQDEVLPIYTENCYCDAEKCEAQCLIGLMEPVYNEYRLAKNEHIFERRSEPGRHPMI